MTYIEMIDRFLNSFTDEIKKHNVICKWKCYIMYENIYDLDYLQNKHAIELHRYFNKTDIFKAINLYGKNSNVNINFVNGKMEVSK